MASQHFPDRLYTSFLAPWNPVMGNAAVVIALRLAWLPWMWLQNPREAERETRKMFDEKESAWQDMQKQAWQTPLRFWMDVASASLTAQPLKAIERAVAQSGRRLAQPYASRVSANRRRLSSKTSA